MLGNKPLGLIVDPPVKQLWDPVYPPTRMIIAPGKVRGRLTGGCMTLIRQLMGTPFAIDTKDRIVFLEDLHEEPHGIDRMLTQLLLAGKLKDAAAIIVGDCRQCSPGDSKRNVLPLNYSLEEVLKDRLGGLGIPVVYGLRLGHGNEKLTLPLGVMASIKRRPAASDLRSRKALPFNGKATHAAGGTVARITGDTSHTNTESGP